MALTEEDVRRIVRAEIEAHASNSNAHAQRPRLRPISEDTTLRNFVSSLARAINEKPSMKRIDEIVASAREHGVKMTPDDFPKDVAEAIAVQLNSSHFGPHTPEDAWRGIVGEVQTANANGARVMTLGKGRISSPEPKPPSGPNKAA